MFDFGDLYDNPRSSPAPMRERPYSARDLSSREANIFLRPFSSDCRSRLGIQASILLFSVVTGISIDLHDLSHLHLPQLAMLLQASTSNMAQSDIYCPICGAALSIPLFRASDGRVGTSAGSARPTDEDMQWLKNVRILYRSYSSQSNGRFVTSMVSFDSDMENLTVYSQSEPILPSCPPR